MASMTALRISSWGNELHGDQQGAVSDIERRSDFNGIRQFLP